MNQKQSFVLLTIMVFHDIIKLLRFQYVKSIMERGQSNGNFYLNNIKKKRTCKNYDHAKT